VRSRCFPITVGAIYVPLLGLVESGFMTEFSGTSELVRLVTMVISPEVYYGAYKTLR